jgi:hypothetical protein
MVETDNSQKKAAGFTNALLNGGVKEVYIILYWLINYKYNITLSTAICPDL